MNDMPNPIPFARALSDAADAVIQERVDAALAAEKQCRLAERVKLEGDAYQRGYQQALTDLEAEWGAAMARLWQGRPAGLLGALPRLSEDEIAGVLARGPRPGAVVALNDFKPTPAMWDAIGTITTARLPDDERALVEQGMDVEAVRTVTPNLYGWPSVVLNIIRRQWPRYVTETEIQAQIEAIYKGSVPVWKIRAQAGAMKLPRPLMPRLAKAAKLVEVNWHQAAMLARGYGIEAFSGDMMLLNKRRIMDGRLPCLLSQPNGPTPEDIATYGEPTL